MWLQPCSTVANENQRALSVRWADRIDATEGNSRYNALQVTFQQRASHGVNFQSNYTWSKSEDTQSTKVQICATLQQCFGVSDFDVTQRFIFSGDFTLPGFRSQNFLAREVLGGWQANLIFNAQTGTPFSVFCPDNNSLTGITETGTTGDFCDLTGEPLQPSSRTYRNWANSAAFKPNAVGTFGTERRNQLRNPGWWNLDSSLFKEFQIKERFKLQLRGEHLTSSIIRHSILALLRITTVFHRAPPRFGHEFRSIVYRSSAAHPSGCCQNRLLMTHSTLGRFTYGRVPHTAFRVLGTSYHQHSTLMAEKNCGGTP